jgi:OmpA-OmpF porin, OOP family
MKDSKKFLLAIVALGSVATFSIPGYAQMSQRGWYADVGAGQGRAHGDDISTQSGRDGVWTARLGARLSPNFAIDAGYEDLGKHDLTAFITRLNGTVKVASWGVSLVAIAPLDKFDIYGRIGYARTESKVDFSRLPDLGLSEKTHDNEAFYGVGARYNFGNLGVFAEWNKHDKTDIDYWLLGVQFRF